MLSDRELLDRLRVSDVLKAVYTVAKRMDNDIFFVGGGLRDMIAAGKVGDMDFAVKYSVREVADAVADLINGTSFPLGREKGCYRVSLKRGGTLSELDFTAYKGPGIEDDLRKRDFTINAMALSVNGLFEKDAPEILDPFEGRADLSEGRLRLVSDNAIDEDPLRILRGFRLSAAFALDMDEEFLTLASEKRTKLKDVSPERIRTELFKTLDHDGACHFIERMVDLEILQEIVPELSSWDDIDQGDKHRFRLLKHSLKTLRYLESILENEYPIFVSYRDKLGSHLKEEIEYGINRRAMLKFAALLHDSGKPCCLGREGDRVTFYGHDEEGARINRCIAGRLKVGRFGRRVLANITRRHMRVLHLSRVEKVTGRAMDRFVRDCGEETPEVLLLALADAWATRDTRDVEYTDVEMVVGLLMERYLELGEEEVVSFLGGRDVMELLGIGEGPEVGKHLALLREEEMAGRINSVSDAVEFLRRMRRSDEVNGNG